jgi:hypothetical protein
MTVPGGGHAFLMIHHTFTDLGVPPLPLTYSVALAVNNEDWVVGQAGNSSGASTVLLCITGGAHSTPHVLGMNNSGEIVGYFAYDNDTSSPALFLPTGH